MLAVEGLVTMKLRRGAYVTDVSRDDVVAGLPPAGAAGERRRGAGGRACRRRAARAACSSCTPGWKGRCASATPSSPTNEQFHMALLDIAGNRWAMQIVTDLRKVMKLNRHHSLFKQGRLERFAGRAPRADGRDRRAGWRAGARTDARALRARARGGSGIRSQGLAVLPLERFSGHGLASHACAATASPTATPPPAGQPILPGTCNARKMRSEYTLH